MGGIRDKMVCDTAYRSVVVELTKSWKLYKMDLGGIDLTCVKTGFGFNIPRQGRPITFYLGLIYYDNASNSSLSWTKDDRARQSLYCRSDWGDPLDWYMLGVRAEEGIDYTPDITAAKRWYWKAASSGETLAVEALKRLQ